MAENRKELLDRLSVEVYQRYPVVAAGSGNTGRELGAAGQYLARAILSVMLDELDRRDSWLPQG